MTENEFHNKTVCVTGAGRGSNIIWKIFYTIELKQWAFLGIGKALALRLAELGAKVIAISKSDENLKQLVALVCILQLVISSFYVGIFE